MITRTWYAFPWSPTWSLNLRVELRNYNLCVAEAHFVYMRRQKLGSSGKRLKLYSDDVYLVICVWNNNLHEPEMNYGIYAAIIICWCANSYKRQHRHFGHFGHKGHQAPQLGTRDTTGNLRQHRLGARDILGFRDTVGTLGTRDTRDITVTRDTTPCTYNGITVNLLRIASLCNNGFPVSYRHSNSHLAIIKCLRDKIHVPDEIS